MWQVMPSAREQLRLTRDYFDALVSDERLEA
jgi:hypothetical protein